jgi:hypothetical protein
LLQVEELLQGSNAVEAETEDALGEAVVAKEPIIIPYGMKVRHQQLSPTADCLKMLLQLCVC